MDIETKILNRLDKIIELLTPEPVDEKIQKLNDLLDTRVDDI